MKSEQERLPGHGDWYVQIDERVIELYPKAKRFAGKYLILEDMDNFDAGEIVNRAAILQQLQQWGRFAA